MNRKYVINGLVGIIFVAILAYVVVNFKGKSTAAPDGKISVVTSFYPLYFFASEIGGSYAQVKNITPAGAEPHDYEPTARDMALIQDSRLLILNGAGFEAWGENVTKNIDSSKTLLVRAGEGLTNQVNDPHVWLSPPVARQMVDAITSAFTKVDPVHAATYMANSESLKEKLAKLDEEYRNSLSNCEQKGIVTSHSAFGYLASAYGFEQISIAGLSPDEEPSAKKLAEVAEFAKVTNVKYIFFESLLSPRFSDTIASEVGAKTLVLNPLEGISEDDLAAGKNYLTEMQVNLDNLKIALECTK